MNIEADEENFGNIAIVVAYLEGAIGVMSYAASKEPKVTGSVILLLSPLMAAASENKQSQTYFYSKLAITAGFGVYNISISNNKQLSEKDIFLRNEIAWHSSFALIVLSGYLLGEFEDKNKSIDYSVNIGNNYMGTSVSYRF